MKSRNQGPVLSVDNLRVWFYTQGALVRAVDGVRLSCRPGETTALLGESGSGKTVTVRAITNLLGYRPGVVGGSIEFAGENLLAGIENLVEIIDKPGTVVVRKDCRHWQNKARRRWQPLYGREMVYVFQEPGLTLNPRCRIAAQILDVAEEHRNGAESISRELPLEVLEEVRLVPPGEFEDRYPHELSTGECQRLAFAMALIPQPRLVIADEPTSSLDVVTQQVVLDYMRLRQDRDHFAAILITHDLQLAHEYARQIVVLHRGRTVEICDRESLSDSDLHHPYTSLLFEAKTISTGKDRMAPAPVSILEEGCAFRDHCREYPRLGSRQHRLCEKENPPLCRVSETQEIACWLYEV